MISVSSNGVDQKPLIFKFNLVFLFVLYYYSTCKYVYADMYEITLHYRGVSQLVEPSESILAIDWAQIQIIHQLWIGENRGSLIQPDDVLSLIFLLFRLYFVISFKRSC